MQDLHPGQPIECCGQPVYILASFDLFRPLVPSTSWTARCAGLPGEVVAQVQASLAKRRSSRTVA